MDGNPWGLPVHAAARDFESLPAELPSHVVDRLLRQDPPGSAAAAPMDSIKVPKSFGTAAMSGHARLVNVAAMAERGCDERHAFQTAFAYVPYMLSSGCLSESL